MYFALQMLLSIFINGITILVFYVLVVKSLLKLNGNFILDDLTFNILVWYTLAMGLVSLVTMIPKFFTCSLIEKFKLIWSIIWVIISMVLITSFVLLLILASDKSTKGITLHINQSIFTFLPKILMIWQLNSIERLLILLTLNINFSECVLNFSFINIKLLSKVNKSFFYNSYFSLNNDNYDQPKYYKRNHKCKSK